MKINKLDTKSIIKKNAIIICGETNKIPVLASLVGP